MHKLMHIFMSQENHVKLKLQTTSLIKMLLSIIFYQSQLLCGRTA